MNQIFQKYVKPNSPNSSIGSWIEWMKSKHSEYAKKGGHLTLEQYALKCSVAMNNNCKVRNVEGEDSPETKPNDKSGKFADTSFWSKYKKPLVWGFFASSAILIGYAIWKEEKE